MIRREVSNLQPDSEGPLWDVKLLFGWLLQKDPEEELSLKDPDEELL